MRCVHMHIFYYIFQLPRKEVETVEYLMNHYETLSKNHESLPTFEIKGTEFSVSPDGMTDNLIYAYKPSNNAQDMDVAWAARQGDYLIVAVAPAGMNEQCWKIVNEIKRYLAILMESQYASYEATRA